MNNILILLVTEELTSVPLENNILLGDCEKFTKYTYTICLGD